MCAAMASAFPNPIPAWVKGAWHTLETTLVEPYVSLLQYIENLGTSHSWMHVACHFRNTATGAVVQDDQYCGFDILNITGGLPDYTWTTSDFTSVEGKLDTFWSGQAAAIPNWLTLVEYKWYVKSFNPMSTTKPFAPHGPPVRITAKAITGSDSNYACAQQAATITKKTPWAKHWGRIYFPYGAGSVLVAAGGRLAGTNPTALATGMQTLNESLAASDYQMVVPSVMIDKAPSRQLLTVTSIQVDDILDVHRSRRPRNPLVRAVKP